MSHLYNIFRQEIENEELRKIDHEINCYLAEEYYKIYAELRKTYCNYIQSLRIAFLAPCCEDCFNEEVFEDPRLPDVSANTWNSDLSLELNPEFTKTIEEYIEKNEEFSFYCLRCGMDLRPWSRNDFYIVRRLLENIYNIPEEVNKKVPSKVIKKKIKKYYGYYCFGCGAIQNLHFDHIIPRNSLGEGSYSNLQLLCEKCGNKKGAEYPEELVLYSFAYFFLTPDDTHEKLTELLRP